MRIRKQDVAELAYRRLEREARDGNNILLLPTHGVDSVCATSILVAR